jgi:Erv1 / Alr family/Thioredoxin
VIQDSRMVVCMPHMCSFLRTPLFQFFQPACNEFKPKYIHLAKATMQRYPSIKFYGVSCDRFQMICDEYQVEDFPTIRLFLEEDDPNSFKGRQIESHSKLSPRTLATLLNIESEGEPHNIFEAESQDEDVTNDSEDEHTDPNKSEDEDANTSEDEDVDPIINIEGLAAQIAANRDPDWEEPESPEEPSPDEPETSEDSEDDSQDMTTEDTNEHIYEPRPPPFAPGKNPNAGHFMAKNGNNQMNRYSSTMAGEKEKLVQKKKGFGFRNRGPKHDLKEGFTVQVSMEDTTETMRLLTPGTVEFQERNKALIDAIRAKMSRKERKDAENLQLKKDSLPFSKDVRKPTLAKKVARHIPGVSRMVKMTDEEELILDTTLSLTVALETGVSMGLEDQESRVAMKNWLDLLSVSLPPEWAVHKMIDNLRNRYIYASKNRDNFRQVIKQQNIPRTGWSDSCRAKNAPNGFSCGMWKLLHVVTVGIAEQRGGKNLIDSGMVPPTTKTFSPMEAADTIREFIAHFFTCKPCRQNFVDNYDDCNNNRRCDRLAYKKDLEAVSIADWKELPLWLWEVHNEVSVRLVNERAQKDYNLKGARKPVTPRDEVKAIFPNVETCILCFNEDGTWNEGQVFRFLERVYWPGSDVDPKRDKLLTFENDGGRGFGLLWMLTLLIIWFVYASTRKQSKSIQSSVLAARRLVSMQTTRLGLKGQKLSSKE